MGVFSVRLRAQNGAGDAEPAPRAAYRSLNPSKALWLAAAGLCALVASIALPSPAFASKFVRLDYNLFLANTGLRHSVFLELFDDRPITQSNFLAYVNGGKYDQSMMHRLAYTGTTTANLTPFVLQGGGYYPQFINEAAPALASWPYSFNPNLTVDLDGNASTPNPTILNEAVNSPARSNVKGTIAMALGGGPNTASSQWFINLGNNAVLDSNGPFTVFAKVLGDGMTAYVDQLVDRTKNNLIVRNMNPDQNDNGVRENGPFYTSEASALENSDGAPIHVDTQAGVIAALQIVNADQIDYYGAGAPTAASAEGLIYVAGRSSVVDTGATFTGFNQFVIEQNRSLQIRGGYSLAGSISSSGIFDPGIQIGKVQVTNYFQNFDGTLKIEIAGNAQDTEYDRVVATNTAFLSGKLDVDFANGYTPAVGSTFTVVNASIVTGLFSLFDLPQLTAGLVWRVSRTGTAYTLGVEGGDYNRDGVVNAADYIVWRNSRGTTVQVGTLVGNGADGDRNGIINDSDYTIWRANIGNVRGISSSGSGSDAGSTVPEQTTVGLSLFALFACSGIRRRVA
jgi:cyclophilin family peptidyl-prolyl cis-trans isomerase